jgi:hypothetical protein
MQAALKKTRPIPDPRPSRLDINDPAHLARFVRDARMDPRAAASDLAHYLDCLRVHYEGCDIARTLDDWAYAPDGDTLDTLVWYAGQGQRRMAAPVHVALCAVIAAARRAGY